MSRESSGLITPHSRVDAAAAQDEARRLASVLSSRGIVANDVVALLMWNDIAFFTLAEACRLVGAYLVPLNWHLTPPELHYILEDCDAKLLFGHDALLRDADIGTRRSPSGVIALATPAFVLAAYPKVQAMPRAAWPVDWQDWHQALAEAAPYTPAASAHERGSVFYTSGTTGKPKGVVRSPLPPEVWAELHARSCDGFGLTVGDPLRRVTVQTGPLYHSAPNAYAQLVWRSGGTVHIAARFDAAELLAQIERERVTHLHLVPTLIKRLLDLPQAQREAHDLSSLVSVCHGAAPCPPEVKRAAIGWLGPIIREYYAGTETGVVAWSTSQDWLAHPGTIGRAASGVDVRVIDPTGREQPSGVDGDLIVRSASTTSFRYHKREGGHAVAGWEGYASLGDVGRIDSQGFIFLSDRRGDMIISGGVNIYPAEIEGELLALPGVGDCVVFGIPDPELGEVVHAVVEPARGTSVDPALLIKALRTRLAAYKLPRAIELCDALPREDSGKIRKRLLRDAHWRALGRNI